MPWGGIQLYVGLVQTQCPWVSAYPCALLLLGHGLCCKVPHLATSATPSRANSWESPCPETSSVSLSRSSEGMGLKLAASVLGPLSSLSLLLKNKVRPRVFEDLIGFTK